MTTPIRLVSTVTLLAALRVMRILPTVFRAELLVVEQELLRRALEADDCRVVQERAS